MMRPEDIVNRARQLVGVRFRPQGRSPEHGLDCVGLAALATGIEGVRRDYALRFGDARTVARGLAGLGFEPVDPDKAQAGDLLVVRPGAGQLHIVVATGNGFVHADAGLRRVVEAPGRAPWPITSAWRQSKTGGA